ncbi:18529_t:CDS:1, partial [Funneliformis geosporum]
YMLKGSKQSKGHYSATCNNCELFWKHGKPYILRKHLANHCKKYPKEISLYYASIVGKDKGKQDIKVEYISSESDELFIKKSKQTAMSNFFEPKKLEKGKLMK